MAKKLSVVFMVLLISIFANPGIHAQEEMSKEKNVSEKAEDEKGNEDYEVVPPHSKSDFRVQTEPVKISQKWDWGKGILLYIPNRILDALDVISMEIGGGPVFAIEVKVTDYFKLGGMHGEFYMLANKFHRQYGGCYMDVSTYSMASFTSVKEIVEDNFGTLEPYSIIDRDLHVPKIDEVYYERGIIDPWSIGVKVALFAEASVEVHPLEIVDFITGHFLIDVMNDDFENTTIERLDTYPFRSLNPDMNSYSSYYY